MSSHHGHHAVSHGRMASSRSDLIELSRHLRHERLYVQHEKQQLSAIHERVKATSERLGHVSWVARQQRENLGQDYAASIIGCQRANLLERTRFVDAYKILSYHEIVYADFLRALRQKPALLAAALARGDKLGLDKAAEVVSAVFGGLYAGCVLPEDEALVLRALYKLMETQLTSAPNPRKLLRQGNCAFTRMYKAFNEELFSAKLFLTSALYEPILAVLTDVEIFLDIDPEKLVIRFPAQDRQRKFGAPDSPEYEARVGEHRAYVVKKLVTLTNGFVESIRRNLYCFPASLARLLRTMYGLLMASACAEPRDVNAVCVDVIFDLFICPAMVDPNPVGIIDTPISYVARSNLMQIAQILKVLALWKWEEIDPRLMDLYSNFDKECMSSVLEAMLEAGEMSEEAEDAAHKLAAGATDDRTEGQSRLAVLLTRQQLEDVIGFLRNLRDHSDAADFEHDNELTALLAPLPENVPGNGADSNNKSSFEDSGSASPATTSNSNSLAAKKQALASKLTNVANSVSKSVVKKEEDSSTADESVNSGTGSSSELVPMDPDTVIVIPITDASMGNEPPGFLSEEHVLTRSRQQSRVVRMNLANLPGGGGSEDGIAESEENSSLVHVGEKRTRFSISHDDGSIGNTSDNLEAISEAASDHSVESSLEDEVDQAEDPIIDNLSDMVSANVSGRGTPNVSGRDTPSSQVTEGEELAGGGGRSTTGNPEEEPNNAAEARRPEEEAKAPEAPAAVERPGPNRGATSGTNNVSGAGAVPPGSANVRGGGLGGRPRRPVMPRKAGETDLEEKFGRFEIKPPPRHVRAAGTSSEQGDETVSMVSDTWSTDVLASDTETLGEGDGVGRAQPPGSAGDLDELARNRMLDELVVPPAAANLPRSEGSLASASGANLLDVAETASEAWSMDVLASDSESLRLGELDNEDTASVAQSDDTRFTDDTTRSDPEPGEGAASGGGNGAASARGGRRDDVTQGKRAPLDPNSKPSRAAAVEQWARQSSGRQPGSGQGLAAAVVAGNLPRRGSDSSGLGAEATSRGKRIIYITQNIFKVTILFQ